MVAVLVKIFGTENFELAEDVVQDSLISALESWKFNGVPENPRAWLYRVAKNKAIDVIRKNKNSNSFDFSDPERLLLTSEFTLSTTMNNYWEESEIKDDFLGMMYACCHPEISVENQITLILKSLCGFSTKEVARSFLTSEDTISKRLFRTKEYFRLNKIRPEIPSKNEILDRTDAVLASIYLMFNEGYNSTHSDEIVREDVISQAMYLSSALLENARTSLPSVYALMALMCFHTARSQSRVSSEGELVLLANQNRTIWDTKLIEKGNELMNQAAFGGNITIYHLEAAIAYEHCVAQTYESTNWQSILGYYDLMLKSNFDPIVFLNRCLVVLELSGPDSALLDLEKLKSDQQMHTYYLYPAILGAVHERLGSKNLAAEHYQKALKLTKSKHEQNLLTEKIQAIWN